MVSNGVDPALKACGLSCVISTKLVAVCGLHWVVWEKMWVVGRLGNGLVALFCLESNLSGAAVATVIGDVDDEAVVACWEVFGEGKVEGFFLVVKDLVGWKEGGGFGSVEDVFCTVEEAEVVGSSDVHVSDILGISGFAELGGEGGGGVVDEELLGEEEV